MSKSFDKIIKTEIDRLTPYFDKVAPEKRALADGLIQNAAFMRATINDLQTEIKENGTTETYKVGAVQEGMKMTAAMQSYNSLIKNYMTAIKTLNGLLPKDALKITDKHDVLAELLSDE